MRRYLLAVLAAVVVCAGMLITASGAPSPRGPERSHIASNVVNALPDGFSDTVDHIFPEGDSPTALAWTPDKRMLATSKEGRLWVFPMADGGYGDPVVALDLAPLLCDDIERGLVGVAVDPAFRTNGFIYVYWTHNVHGTCGSEDIADAPENRVNRFQLADDNKIVKGSSSVIVDHIVSPKAQVISTIGESHSDVWCSGSSSLRQTSCWWGRRLVDAVEAVTSSDGGARHAPAPNRNGTVLPVASCVNVAFEASSLVVTGLQQRCNSGECHCPSNQEVPGVERSSHDSQRSVHVVCGTAPTVVVPGKGVPDRNRVGDRHGGVWSRCRRKHRERRWRATRCCEHRAG